MSASAIYASNESLMNVPYKAYILSKLSRVLRDAYDQWNEDRRNGIQDQRVMSVKLNLRPGWDSEAMLDFLYEKAAEMRRAMCKHILEAYDIDIEVDEVGWDEGHIHATKWELYMIWQKPSNPFTEAADDYVGIEAADYDSEDE